MKANKSLLILCIFFILASFGSAYKVETNSEVHQYLTNESKTIWPLITYESSNHITNPISTYIDFEDYDEEDYNNRDDVINGSLEEDVGGRPLNHFWNPDSVDSGKYNDGLNVFGSNYDSSYRKAMNYWTTKVIPLYAKGEINESYYWLGRVAHLLEDASQPGHILLDCHADNSFREHFCDDSDIEDPDDSVLEEYTGDNFQTLRNSYNWSGENFIGQQYNYENLPNLSIFNWKEVQPSGATDKKNVELFRLFWYTSQKTQYFASDDVNGNSVYVNLSGSTKSFPASLWDEQNIRIINRSAYLLTDDITNSGPNISAEANAMIPHAMRAVSGLYRLFDDAVRIDWPTENHDFRRTGFTLLKGDLTSVSKTKSAMDFFMDGSTGSEQVVKPSIADIDGNGVMDIITLVHKTSNNNLTKMYGIQAKDPLFGKPKRLWSNPVEIRGGEEGAIYFPATLANIDGDINKEIITGTRNGTIYVYDYSGGTPSVKWTYYLETRSDGINDRVKFNGGSAVTDIDLDGDQEIIVADVLDNDDDWPGKVYILDGDDGTNQTSYIVGNGGAYASVSVANLDSDDYPEIVVPTQYGIKVLDYNPSTNKLTEKCSNTHGYLWGSALIADVDYDNEYELVYVTSSTPCAAGKTCENKLYVINASSCTVEKNIALSNIPRPTPTVANLDSDANLELIVSEEQSVPDGLGSIKAYDYSAGTAQWTYNAGGSLHPGFVSPNIADIDNDGNYNIVLGENGGSSVYVLNNDGSLKFSYEVVGFMDNGIAIADLDNDGMAEIAFKRAGSPETVFVSISAINTQPEIAIKNNVTAIAGDLINISQLVTTSDAENSNLDILYSSPFNSSGQWQTTVNDTGNYSVLVEASDGNLSSYQYIDVIVFNQTTVKVNNFTDGSTSKLLNFTQPGNLTLNVRLLKNTTVVYSKLTIKGLAP